MPSETLQPDHRPYSARSSGSTRPFVSICIPTFNAAAWILECIGSALAQSYQDLEVLIVDDASTDETVELIRAIDDPRIRLEINPQNLGLAPNWNRCIELSHGDFIKFLFHDDILYPDCVEKMMQLILSNEHIGLVFSPRDIILEDAPQDELTRIWLKNCATLHTRFSQLELVNDGKELFAQYLRKGFGGNWIGEPSSVLVRKGCFSSLGMFDPKLRQVCDVEMWLRIMFSYDIGFLPEKHSAFRLHRDSTSRRNLTSKKNFLDQLWLIESLSNSPAIKAEYPEIEGVRAIELLRLVKAVLLSPIAIGRCVRTDPVGRLGLKNLPAWIRSAAAYSVSRMFSRRNSNRSSTAKRLNQA
jgi:glycosyltransferase involved in cell wall biosynthesis